MHTPAQGTGRFDAELVPVGGVTADDSLRASAPSFGQLPPLFPGGTLTAGTSTRISDGAAALLLVPQCARGRAPGLAIRSHAVVGCDPALPGRRRSRRRSRSVFAGLGLEDLTAIEIVEAFAAQSLAVLDRVGLAEDDPRVCADGGALALGHPWGASGAVAMVRLFSRLIRGAAPAGSLGVAAASIGGGMGIAAVVEVIR